SSHPHYSAFRTLVGRGLSVAGYVNEPNLDDPVTVLSFAYLVSNVATRFHDRPDIGSTVVAVALEAAAGDGSAPLDAEVAGIVTRAAACAIAGCPGEGWSGLAKAGLAWQELPPSGDLVRGQAYELAAALAHYFGPH